MLLCFCLQDLTALDPHAGGFRDHIGASISIRKYVRHLMENAHAASTLKDSGLQRKPAPVPSWFGGGYSGLGELLLLLGLGTSRLHGQLQNIGSRVVSRIKM